MKHGILTTKHWGLTLVEDFSDHSLPTVYKVSDGHVFFLETQPIPL